jgi:hypothetical protein
MRTKQSEFAFERHLSAIVFSPDESSLLAVYQNKLRSISLADGTSMGVRPLLCRDCRSLAVHPDGVWLALNYDGMLGLADVRALDPVLLFGIGGLLDYGPVMAQMFNEAELERMSVNSLTSCQRTNWNNIDGICCARFSNRAIAGRKP